MEPGTILGDRYTLKNRLGHTVVTSSWQAQDEVLGRRVFVRFVSNDFPHVEAVTDAARRAASIDDPRLNRILDIGRVSHNLFVVNEWINALSLSTILRNGPLAIKDVRIIARESSLALESARHRGIHHLNLNPNYLYYFNHGEVRISEIAVAATLAGHGDHQEDLGSEQATATDIISLVAILYAGLTGRWPLFDNRKAHIGIPEAPMERGLPVLPSTLRSNIPPDLDKICEQSLHRNFPPKTLKELADLVSPKIIPKLNIHESYSPPSSRESGTITQKVNEPFDERAGKEFSTSYLQQFLSTSHEALEEREDFLQTGSATKSKFESLKFSKSAKKIFGNKKVLSTLFYFLILGIVILLAYLGLRDLKGTSLYPRSSAASSPSRTLFIPPTAESLTKTIPSQRNQILIRSARGYDPEGNGTEKDEEAYKAFDGDSETKWTSLTYKTSTFGNLKKGVGLLLELDGSKSISYIRLRLGQQSDSTVELRTINQDDSLAPILSSQEKINDQIEITPLQSTKIENLVLWFTTPSTVNGGFRVEVVEVEIE
ncbi:MAG: protein kinase family protein [Actinomycetota bacterium]